MCVCFHDNIKNQGYGNFLQVFIIEVTCTIISQMEIIFCSGVECCSQSRRRKDHPPMTVMVALLCTKAKCDDRSVLFFKQAN